MNMKKFLIIVCVIAVIIFLGYIGKDMNLTGDKNNETNNTSSSNVITGKNTTNTSKNTVNTTNTSNETNNTTENKTENNTVQNTTPENTTNQTKEPSNEVANVSDEDQALNLAKKQYGTTDGVYFKIEQVEGNGVYIVSVRDMETTSAIEWYNVNVKTQTVK